MRKWKTLSGYIAQCNMPDFVVLSEGAQLFSLFGELGGCLRLVSAACSDPWRDSFLSLIASPPLLLANDKQG